MPATGGSSVVLMWIVGLAIAGGVSYFTSKSTIESRVTQVETKEATHFEEVQRSLDRIERSLERTNERLETRPPIVVERERDQAPPVRSRPTPIFSHPGSTVQ